jgi:hypothetical protein
MAKQFPAIDENHRNFIARQRIFFTASATDASRVNVSPRSTDSFRVLSGNRIVYLDRTGSGNETAAHLLADGRLTIMFCAFEGAPLILRLYGRGRAVRRDSPEYQALLTAEFSGHEPLGARQMIHLDVELVQTSCGFGVPLFDYQAERPALDRWTEVKGDQIEAYRREKNRVSIDGLPTGLFAEEG